MATDTGWSQLKLIVEPAPIALINAIQQIGHFGITAISRLVTADSPIFLDRLPMLS
jgi:hypothetical protein